MLSIWSLGFSLKLKRPHISPCRVAAFVAGGQLAKVRPGCDSATSWCAITWPNCAGGSPDKGSGRGVLHSGQLRYRQAQRKTQPRLNYELRSGRFH